MVRGGEGGDGGSGRGTHSNERKTKRRYGEHIEVAGLFVLHKLSERRGQRHWNKKGFCDMNTNSTNFDVFSHVAMSLKSCAEKLKVFVQSSNLSLIPGGAGKLETLLGHSLTQVFLDSSRIQAAVHSHQMYERRLNN